MGGGEGEKENQFIFKDGGVSALSSSSKPLLLPQSLSIPPCTPFTPHSTHLYIPPSIPLSIPSCSTSNSCFPLSLPLFLPLSLPLSLHLSSLFPSSCPNICASLYLSIYPLLSLPLAFIIFLSFPPSLFSYLFISLFPTSFASSIPFQSLISEDLEN